MANAELLASLRARMAQLEQGGAVNASHHIHGGPSNGGASSSQEQKLSSLQEKVQPTLQEKGQPTSREKGQPAPQKKGQPPDAFAKIVALVNVSERSQHAVRERLEKDGFTNQEIDEALSRALEYGFIDDMRFAAILIRSRLNQGKGVVGIARELKGHGIELEDVPGWPHEFTDEDSERARALRYLEKHPTRSKNKREGAYRKLVQRGFAASVASSVAREWSEQV